MGFLDNQGLATLWECIVGKIEIALGTVKAFSNITTKSGSTVTTVEAPGLTSGLTIEAGDNITLVTNAATNTIKIIGADAPEAPEASLESLGISATPTEINHIAGATSNIQNQLNAKVPTSRTINGKALSSNISLTYSDVDAAPEEHTHDASDITAGTLAAARLPNISIDKLVAGTTNATIPSSLLPAYVDDVLEYAAKANFPTTGETGKIYVDKATNLTYRWSGSAYVEISPSLALGTTSSTAYRGDLGAAAYAHAVTNKGVAKSSGLYKITTNSEGHVTAGTAVTKADITGLGIPGEKSTLSDLGITATAAELNKMDGVTATTAELNYVDGVTSNIQTQLNNRLNLHSTGTTINQNDDLNDYTTPGVYTAVLATAQTLSNTPCQAGFKLVVMQGYSSNYISQFIFRGNTNQWWYRSYSYINEPIWTDWCSYLPTSGGTMTGKLVVPTDFTVQSASYPTINFVDTDDNIKKAALVGDMGERRLYMRSYASDTSYYENFHLPSASTGLTANKQYNILTTKNKVTVAQGGTGGTTAKAAAYNLLNDMTDSSIALTDDSKFVFKLATTASIENGVLMTKSASLIWDYIKSKADSHYLGISSTLPISKGGTGATTAAGALTNLGAAPASHTHSEYYNIYSSGTAITENADLNTYTTPGVYYAIQATAATLSNCPTSSGFKLVVERGYSTGRYIQRAIGGSTANAEWVRYYSGSAWGDWQRTVRADSASSAYPTYLQTYSSYDATFGFGCSNSGMWMRAFRDGEYGEYLYMTKDGRNVYTYARDTTDTKVSTLYGTANIHYGSSTPTGAYTGQLWFKPV